MPNSRVPDPDPPLAARGAARLLPMQLSDLEQILKVERVSYPSPWRREHFLHEIERNPWALNRVVKSGRIVLAYACAWAIRDELKINNLAVRPASRARGLGHWLLSALLREGWSTGCDVARLEVRPSNAAALALYRRLGFVVIGRRKNYYEREGEDAIVMEVRRAAVDVP